MTLLLGGGGDADDERPILDRFLELTQDGTIAYWPVALDRAEYSAATAFAQSALGRDISTWTRLEDHSPEEIADHAGVFIGGGNTYHLLNEIRRSGMVDSLRAFAVAGVLYGGSAGAIVCGADIDTAAYFDANEIGLADTTGLGLLGSYAVWCHFEDDHVDALTGWVRARGHPVVALPERSGAEVAGVELSSIGRDPLFVVDRHGTFAEVVPGRIHSLVT